MKMAWRAVLTQWSLSLERFSVFEEIMSAILSRYFRLQLSEIYGIWLCVGA